MIKERIKKQKEQIEVIQQRIRDYKKHIEHLEQWIKQEEYALKLEKELLDKMLKSR